MDRNFLLAMALSMAVVVTWTMYTEGQRQQYLAENPEAAAQAAAEAAGEPAEPSNANPFAEEPSSPAPSAGTPLEPTAPLAAEATPIAPPPVAVPTDPEVRTTIRTGLYEAELTSHGGALTRWTLLEYDDPSQAGRPRVEVTTLAPGGIALATPLLGLGLGDLSKAGYRLEEPDPLTRIFTLERGGVVVRKSYFFKEDEFTARLRIEVENRSGQSVQPRFAVQWPMLGRDSDDFEEYAVALYHESEAVLLPLRTAQTFLGFGGAGLEEKANYTGDVEWLAADTTYFLAAIVPENPARAEARVAPLGGGDSALVEIRVGDVTLPAGQRLDNEYSLYVGPKIQERLDGFGSHLDEAIAKGWFPSLTRFFVWLLDWAYGVVPNYGLAIILITVIVRLLMAPLMSRQMKSMKRMSDIAPKMKELQEKYKDDRERQSQEMMALYKREGVSPFSMLSGCLPMLLQFPVFIGFYFALRSTIQLRQQPFFGWIDDLSRPEALFVVPGIELPIRVLPIAMGASMFLQQKLTPSGSMDPAQQRMMMTIMPVMFTVLFYQFASGLVLYWFFSTLIGIGQQLYTNRNTPAPASAES